MLPSPSKLRNHDLSKPIDLDHYHKSRNTPKRTPFTAPPSRLVLHKCPNSTRLGTPPADPVATLNLSLPLAKKIHNLILTSREMESLAKSLFSGKVGQAAAASRMESLEAEYNRLREAVECELETAWVNAGFLPATMPTLPQIHNFQATSRPPGGEMDWRADSYTVDRDLKRKREEEEYETRTGDSKRKKKRARKDKSKRDNDEPEGWTQPGSLQPVGIQQAMIPLRPAEKDKMRMWTMDSAWGSGRGMDSETLSSPRGTVFVR